MVSIIDKIRFIIVRGKFFTYRSSLYMGLMNMAMICYIFISDLQTKGYPIKDYQVIIIYILIIFFVLLFGYLEYKLKFLAEEQGFIYQNIPQMQELIKEVKELKEEIKKLK